MNPEIIETKRIKAIVRVFGIFITAIAILGTIDGVALGFGGIENHNLWAIMFGLGTVLSWFGLVGAWVRIKSIYSLMSTRKIYIVRSFLVLGFFSTLFLSFGAIAMFYTFGLYCAAFFSLIGLCALIFLFATPKKP